MAVTPDISTLEGAFKSMRPDLVGAVTGLKQQDVTTMRNFDHFMAANEEYASNFDKDNKSQAPLPPARRAATIMCMDSRLNPFAFLGLREGEVHIIRNGGGRVSKDVLRALVASQQTLGTREVYLIHHTDCGFTKFSNPLIHGIIKAKLGADVSKWDFRPFSESALDESVREDVNQLATSELVIKGCPIYGLVYDCATGRLREVTRCEGKEGGVVPESLVELAESGKTAGAGA